MNDDIINAQYDITKKSKLKIFYEKYRTLLISSIIFLLILIGAFIFYLNNLENKKVSLSDDYVQARVYVNKNENTKAIKLLEKIIFLNDPYYSTLSFFYIIDQNLITDNNKINLLFNHVLDNNNFDNEVQNLLVLKKAIYNSDQLNELELLESISPIINNESLWKPHALMLIGDYFLSKNENLKAKEYYLQILNIKGLNQGLYDQAKTQLSYTKND